MGGRSEAVEALHCQCIKKSQAVSRARRLVTLQYLWRIESVRAATNNTLGAVLQCISMPEHNERYFKRILQKNE